MTATWVEKGTKSRFARANPSRGQGGPSGSRAFALGSIVDTSYGGISFGDVTAPPRRPLRIERAAHDVGRRDVFDAAPQVNVRWQ